MPPGKRDHYCAAAAAALDRDHVRDGRSRAGVGATPRLACGDASGRPDVFRIRARDLARAAASQAAPLPPAYFRAMRWWFWLGWPAFLSVIAIFWMMVQKPV
ncbi:MAG: DUF2269 family protein [Pseudomonadota bacterium]